LSESKSVKPTINFSVVITCQKNKGQREKTVRLGNSRPQ